MCTLGNIPLNYLVQVELRKIPDIKRAWGDEDARAYEWLKYDAPLHLHDQLRAKINWFPVPRGRNIYPDQAITWADGLDRQNKGIVHLDRLRPEELENAVILVDINGYSETNRAEVCCLSIHKELAALATKIKDLPKFIAKPTTLQEYAHLHQSFTYNLRHNPQPPATDHDLPQLPGFDELFDQVPLHTSRNPTDRAVLFDDNTIMSYHSHVQVFNGVDTTLAAASPAPKPPLRINQLIPGLPPETFRSILQYLYTGELPLLSDLQCFEVLKFAQLSFNAALERLVRPLVEDCILLSTMPVNFPSNDPESLAIAASMLHAYLLDKAAPEASRDYWRHLSKYYTLGV